MLTSSSDGEKPENVEVKFADFDSVQYHVSTPKSKTILQVSISLVCFKELAKYGVKELLTREYGSLLSAEPEAGYDATLEINMESLPASPAG